ncbi:YciI family protein [Niabella sp. CC-SYL272]|uniref:YciI family protein n=1 Tax=Niabella agricola TaxID=2891571 RepID=UPI001F270C3B|nr:YciI family protein [Niabella agricola]MCF3112230.1 YciI family protein [Niabella agricola]
MKKFIALFREPDGRADQHTENAIKAHRENWAAWMKRWQQQINGGSGLTLDGRMLKAPQAEVIHDVYKNGTEIVGGFLLITATDLDAAAAMMQSCPIFEFGGYIEIRELQQQ